MAKVVIALGSNSNRPYEQLKKAARFLNSISISPIQKSFIYASEPIGPSEQDFFNAVILIESQEKPGQLFEQLKEQEKAQGRPSRYPKWTARTIDLDIIAYNDLVVQTDTLIIPHSEYTHRLFVLLPLKDTLPTWKDPISAQPISELIKHAPAMRISKTDLNW